MLALEPAIVTRLRGELPGTWSVKGAGQSKLTAA